MAIGIGVAIALFLGYKYLLKLLQKGKPSQQYAMLHTIHNNTATGETRFYFELPENTHVNFIIVDGNENEIAVLMQGNLNKGSYPVKWNSTDVKNGQYFYKLETNNQTISKKLTVTN